jgi:asparagine synthase (glutamine-hydrolysing)
MCGIVGALDLHGTAAGEDLVRRMAAAIAHRGPDDEGFFVDRALALGFKRLSVIDLDSGHQPMTSDCGRFTIVFNGEIYNYRELRAGLERDHGVVFRTSSDTEVILAAYRQWGGRAVACLNGMFALAIWDAREQTLFLARDRLGKKPLYFIETRQGFCFASEVKALLRGPAVEARVDRRRLATFLAYRYVPGDETLFDGVRCLPPACRMNVSLRTGVGAAESYWDYCFPSTAVRASPQSVEAELNELLHDSVRLRMIADVPVGAFLSGGVDSSLVVALMARMHPEPLRTFSIGFDTGFSEAGYARVVAERFGTDHHEIIVGSGDLIRNIPRVLHARETPITEASDIPIHLLAKLARTKVTVVLSGEGSDEILAGYPKYVLERRLERAPDLVPWSVLGALAPALPFALRRAQLALECTGQRNRFERYACWFGAFGPRQRAALLAPDLAIGDGIHAFSEGVLRGKRFSSRVEEMLYLDTRHWLPANLLLRGDRLTMTNSLELRCPFLDYRLVEFAAREVPLDLKVHGLSGKWILKRLAAKLLPREVVRRRKWGFKVPLKQWFRGPLARVAKDVLLSPRALARGYFREEGLRRLLDAHVAGQTNYEKQLWILLQLELWHLMFVDRTLSPSDSLE